MKKIQFWSRLIFANPKFTKYFKDASGKFVPEEKLQFKSLNEAEKFWRQWEQGKIVDVPDMATYKQSINWLDKESFSVLSTKDDPVCQFIYAKHLYCIAGEEKNPKLLEKCFSCLDKCHKHVPEAKVYYYSRLVQQHIKDTEEMDLIKSLEKEILEQEHTAEDDHENVVQFVNKLKAGKKKGLLLDAVEGVAKVRINNEHFLARNVSYKDILYTVFKLKDPALAYSKVVEHLKKYPRDRRVKKLLVEELPKQKKWIKEYDESIVSKHKKE